MEEVLIRSVSQSSLAAFLEDRGFIVEEVEEKVVKIHRLGGEDIFVVVEEETLYFQQPLGALKELASQDFYFDLLALNSEITPISVAIDTSEEQPQLILVERQLRFSLDGDELLGVIDAMELAGDRIEAMLKGKMEER